VRVPHEEVIGKGIFLKRFQRSLGVLDGLKFDETLAFIFLGGLVSHCMGSSQGK
jgi:hypothetical protein